MKKSKKKNREPNTKCALCGKEIFKWPFELRKNKNNFCSNECAKKFKIEQQPNTECALCGKKFYRTPNKKRSKTGLYFCCKEHQNEGYRKHLVISGPKTKFSNLIVTNYEKYCLEKRKSNRVRQYNKNRRCKDCGKTIYNYNKSGYCIVCYHKHKIITDEMRRKISSRTKKLMKEGKIKSWQSRNIMSYPEKFFKKVLESNNIDFEGPNYVVKQKDLGVPNCKPSSCYFLDFKIGNIDLEIDGKQHSYKEQLEKDKIRDKYLSKAGYIIYRIKWKDIKSNQGKQYIKGEIEKLLKFITTSGEKES